MVFGVSRAGAGDAKDPAVQDKILKAAQLSQDTLITCKQAHTSNIAIVEGPTPDLYPETDGLLTDREGLVLGVFSADCMPILLWQEDKKIIGAIHMGWRGAAHKILTEAVRLLRLRWKVQSSTLGLFTGPHIRQCCYEVGEETAAFFPAGASKREGGRTFLSLSRTLIEEAMDLGIPAERIRQDPGCTHCEADFFSYRRDKAAQRMLSYVSRKIP